MSSTFEAAWSALDHLRVLHSRATGSSQKWLEGIIGRCDLQILHKCYRIIAESIDVDLSRHSKQTCIQEGYNQELDDLRAKWDDVESILEGAARRTLTFSYRSSECYCPGPPAAFTRPRRFPQQIVSPWRLCVGEQAA